MPVKKLAIWLLCLSVCLWGGVAAYAQAQTPATSYAAMALPLPAAGLAIAVPADMDRLEADEEAYDLGFRFDCYTDTFDLTVSVLDTRDMEPADFAAFYALRHGQTASADRVNGYAVQRLSDAARPYDVTVLVGAPDQIMPAVVYALRFSCDGETDAALAQEILGTLGVYD